MQCKRAHRVGRKRSKTLEELKGTKYGVAGLGGVIALDVGVKLVICMCGVVGCGKTYGALNPLHGVDLLLRRFADS